MSHSHTNTTPAEPAETATAEVNAVYVAPTLTHLFMQSTEGGEGGAVDGSFAATTSGT